MTDLGSGRARIGIRLPEKLYYRTLGELTGFDITGEESLIGLLRDLSEVKKEYDRIADALHDAGEKGYGIVTPDVTELKLEEPEIIRQPRRLRREAQGKRTVPAPHPSRH